jgi:hypothetical protein
MKSAEREKIRIEIVAFVKEYPGRYTRPTVLKKLGYWDRKWSGWFYRLFVMLEETELVRYERTGDGLLKVYPGRNAARFGGG